MTIDIQLSELSPNSRFSIHDAPMLAPGTCFICGDSGGDGRKFLDFGKQMQWYGAIYFCSECIREIAEAVGFYPKDVVTMLMAANEELSAKNVLLNDNLRNVSESHRAIARHLANCTCSIDGPNNDDDENDGTDSDSESNDSEPIEFDGLKGFGGIRSTGDDE